MRGLSQGPPVKKLNTNHTDTSFIEYKEYLDLFSYPEANIRTQVKSDQPSNLEIFKKFYSEQKQKQQHLKTRRTHDSMGSVPKYFPDKRASQSSIVEKQSDYVNSYGKPEYSFYRPDEASAYESNYKSINSSVIEKSRVNSSAISKNNDSIIDPLIAAVNKRQNQFRKLKIIDTKEVQELKEKGEKYLRIQSSNTKPRTTDYKLIGNKRMQTLQVDYFQKLGLLDMLNNNH